MSSVNTNQKSPKNPFKTPVGESNAENETLSEETETREGDNVEDLFLQMMLTESEEKRCNPPSRVSRDFNEQRFQDSDKERSQEQVQQTLPPSGFDLRHIMVLRNLPISSFYGVDIDNLSLPIQLPSSVGSFYGFDEESLAAENAALDEFYANLKREKAACGKDLSSGRNVGSFYGLDKESLEAENAKLDEFYDNIKSEKAACGKDQSSGSKCS